MKKWPYSEISRPWADGRRLFLLFFFIFLLINLFLGQQKIFELPPQGVHLGRQADGLTFTYNYYKDGLNLFNPHLNNLQSEGGCKASEFPLIYAVVASLYKIFGPHIWIFRLITLLIVFFGFYSLFRMLSLVLNDMLQGMALSLIFFSSSILIYYSANFLPDPAALAFSLAGWWFFFKYSDKQTQSDLWLCFLFFTVGALLNLSYALNPMTAIGIFIIERFWGIRLKDEGHYFKHPVTFTILSFVFILLVFLWDFWMHQYNNLHGNSYFPSSALPLWEASGKEIRETWQLITNYWYTKYYYESIFHFFLLILILGVLWISRSGRLLVFLSVMIILGGLFYFLLFYQQFAQHDYYMINLMTVILFPVLASLKGLKQKFPKQMNTYFMTLLLFILSFLGIQYAKINFQRRYDSTVVVGTKFNVGFYEIKPYLAAAGVSSDARIISVPDPSPNISLYFIDHMGWTIPAETRRMRDTIRYFIRLGANYLLISDTSLTKQAEMQGFLLHKCMDHKGISLYKLYPTMDSLQCLFLPSTTGPWRTRFK